MTEEKQGLKRSLFIWMGHFFVGLGFVGIIVPLMPGTVFFIVAAYFYARGSKKFYNWLINHPSIGTHIKNYQAGKITLKGKIISISSMTIAILLSIFLIYPPVWVIALLIACNVAVSLYILSLKTA
jgi:uncharacterized membrane protein YbaN (DUF454 family)